MTTENANLIAATATQLQIDKSIAENEIRKLDLRQGIQESDTGLIKRVTVQQFHRVESVIESQERTLNELKSTKNVDDLNVQDGRDTRGLGRKLNLGNCIWEMSTKEHVPRRLKYHPAVIPNRL